MTSVYPNFTGGGLLAGATPSGPTPTPAKYHTGSVKQQAPGTGMDQWHLDMRMVAVRTSLPTADGSSDWSVMCAVTGGHYSNYDGVSSWPDILVL